MSKVEVSNEGPIKTITLNRPEKRNALDQEMLNNLYDIFSEKVSAFNPEYTPPSKANTACFAFS